MQPLALLFEGTGGLPPHQAESEVPAEGLLDGEREPQHGAGFEQARYRERACIERIEAQVHGPRVGGFLGVLV